MDRCPSCNVRLREPVLAVCLDCGVGAERASLTDVRGAVDVLRTWLADAGTALASMEGQVPLPRYAAAVAQLRRRQAVYRQLTERQQARESVVDEVRFPFTVKWAAQQGVLLVRDVFDGDWLEVSASQVPDHWRHAATADARAAREKRRNA